MGKISAWVDWSPNSMGKPVVSPKATKKETRKRGGTSCFGCFKVKPRLKPSKGGFPPVCWTQMSLVQPLVGAVKGSMFFTFAAPTPSAG